MTVETMGGSLPEKRLEVVVTGLSSDAHTWNLVYLELLLEELGCEVTNLGACTPDDVILRECEKRRPDLLVIGSLNGHGYQDGMRLIAAFRECSALALVPVVIGGKLDVSGGADAAATARLLAAGFDAVFDAATADRPLAFRSFVNALATRADVPGEDGMTAHVGAGTAAQVGAG